MTPLDFHLCLRTWVCLSVILVAGTAWGAPCTTATNACTEWIPVSVEPARALVYRTYALDIKNASLTRALVVVHGAGRDADSYFRHVLAAAFLAGALDDTAVVSTRFASNDGANCRDSLGPDELNWVCPPGPWRSANT